MSVPTLDELVETFCELHFADSREPWPAFAKRCPELAISLREDAKRALLAVLDRLKPVVAEAYASGQAFEVDQRQPNAYMPRITPEMYATRIIDQIKGA